MGMETPTREITMLILSKNVFCLTAARIPRGIARRIETIPATMDRLNVYGNRENTSSATGRFVAYDVPRSPLQKLTIYLTYWTMTGSFNPISSRSSSTCSWVAPSPRSSLAAPPGASCITMKTKKVTPNITGISESRRLIINLIIASSS